jgi:DNA primase
MAYTKTDLDTIRNKVDMLTFLEERGVAFRQTGVSWVGLCPVHNERSPSFHVKPANQTFHCFGCGISGDIFSLVQEIEKLSFPGAVQLLAEEVGIELQADEDPNFKRRQRLLQITRLTSEWFRWNYSQIPMNHAAKEDLAKRNLLEYSLSDESIGFAPNSGLIEILTKKGFSLQELADAGVIKIPEDGKPAQERFRNRLTWTVYDIQGHPIGFSARKIFDNDNGPKYLNSPQTELYNKSRTLLGLSTAKKAIAQQQEVYVVEGNADVMAMKAAGKINTVASCGTSFGTDHANMLLHLSNLGKDADKFKIIFCFDGDAAGVKAAKNVFEKNKSIQLNSYVVKFEDSNGDSTDPCDFRTDHGDTGLLEAISPEHQVSLVEFVLSEARKEWNLETPEGQSGFVNKARDILSFVSDPIQYSSYLRKVAFWTGISFSQISTMVRQKATYAKPEVAPTRSENAVQSEGDKFENTVLAAFVQYPEESLDLMDKYNMDLTFFPTCRDLALELISQIDGEGLDYSNPQVSLLSHVNLMITEDRKEIALDILFKNYLKRLYTAEIDKLDAILNSGQNNAFQKLMDEQARLKVKYSI